MLQELGILRLRITVADIMRQGNPERIDAYCEVEFNGEFFKTSSFLDPFRQPSWNEEFPLHVYNLNDEVRIKVYDLESYNPNGLVGSVKIKVSLLCMNNGVKEWFSIDYNSQPVGKIHVKSRFIPNQFTLPQMVNETEIITTNEPIILPQYNNDIVEVEDTYFEEPIGQPDLIEETTIIYPDNQEYSSTPYVQKPGIGGDIKNIFHNAKEELGSLFHHRNNPNVIPEERYMYQ